MMFNRRSALCMLGAAGVAHAGGGLFGSLPIQIGPMPVTVPANFVACYSTRWPYYSSSFWAPVDWNAGLAVSASPPSGLFKSFRGYDDSTTMWGLIETSAGVYNWTQMDAWLSAYRALGCTDFDWTIGGTPTFYASAGDQAHLFYSIYGGAGYPASTSPNGLTALGNFITAAVTRYNTPGGGWSGYGTYGKGIQSISIWNEPVYVGYGSAFWWGTVGQMVDVGYTIRTAAKAVDSSIIVGSPGFNTAQNGLLFLQGTGAIHTTVTGASLCDVINVHNYNCNLPGEVFGDWVTYLGGQTVNLGYDERNGGASNEGVGYVPWTNMMKASGVGGLPIWMEEGGFDYRSPSGNPPALTLMQAQTPAYRQKFWTRMMMLGAARGYARWLTYAWDGPFNCYPNVDYPGGCGAAMAAIRDNVVGKTITSAYYTIGGPVTLNFSDTSSYTV